ncbi:polysaccharide deacetylase [Petralouisia muris]|jgi:peptidoglycan/xylan/chitin deacetylase (PgdA/CDA1 family)|uniref:Polysaccharide deacetylase n=1 Tax=Petralouisia muris TaxID=3032872 RepID=A0AC61RYJ7_9FIRM|nr:polysaccharide deacetylase family protein [Petralouisia muris]TGY96962.1 polysaccharide deacetylase [Petralouisia muris]
MEDNTTSGLREQQLRRKRIRKMKSTIIAGVVIWILGTSILSLSLLVKLLHLESRMEELAESVISVEQVVENVNEKSAASPDGNAKTADPVKNGTILENALEEGESRKVYLTFDDGPSENTAKILDILKEKNVKATFFVIGQEDEESKEMYQRIVAEGHTLGMHSFSHKYSVIYQSLEAFSEDMAHLQSYLSEVTGVTPEILRFPGGSSNQVSNTDMREFIRFLNEKGITYYDWNVASGDATSQAYTPDELVQNVMNDVGRYETSIVLMHDASNKSGTVEALPVMIDKLQELGVELLPIDENTTPIQQIPADSVQ